MGARRKPAHVRNRGSDPNLRLAQILREMRQHFLPQVQKPPRAVVVEMPVVHMPTIDMPLLIDGVHNPATVLIAEGLSPFLSSRRFL